MLPLCSTERIAIFTFLPLCQFLFHQRGWIGEVLETFQREERETNSAEKMQDLDCENRLPLLGSNFLFFSHLNKPKIHLTVSIPFSSSQNSLCAPKIKGSLVSQKKLMSSCDLYTCVAKGRTSIMSVLSDSENFLRLSKRVFQCPRQIRHFFLFWFQPYEWTATLCQTTLLHLPAFSYSSFSFLN